MKLFLLIPLITLSFSAFTQFSGAQQVFGAATNIGRQIKQADNERKEEERREEINFNYFVTISEADTLFAKKNYSESIKKYNAALMIKQEEYPKDQISKAKLELARQRNDSYQAFLDSADKFFNEMEFDQAILNYEKASKIRNDTYPTKQIEKSNLAKLNLRKVHFSGLLISGTRVDGITSKVHSVDPYSDFISPGSYISITDQLIYSSYQTIDGIAVPSGVRLIVYSQQGFRGKILLDVTGPMIINNSAKKMSEEANFTKSSVFPSFLNELYPESSRIWSETDMQKWITGSMNITSN